MPHGGAAATGKQKTPPILYWWPVNTQATSVNDLGALVTFIVTIKNLIFCDCRPSFHSPIVLVPVLENVLKNNLEGEIKCEKNVVYCVVHRRRQSTKYPR